MVNQPMVDWVTQFPQYPPDDFNCKAMFPTVLKWTYEYMPDWVVLFRMKMWHVPCYKFYGGDGMPFIEFTGDLTIQILQDRKKKWTGEDIEVSIGFMGDLTYPYQYQHQAWQDLRIHDYEMKELPIVVAHYGRQIK